MEYMSKNEIEDTIKKLKIKDNVAIIRDSTKKGCIDYMNCTVEKITDKTIVVSFQELRNKTVKKESIRSIAIL